MAPRERVRARMLTPEEVAAELRVSRATLRRWRFQGEGPPARQLVDGGAVRYERSELERWLRSRPA